MNLLVEESLSSKYVSVAYMSLICGTEARGVLHKFRQVNQGSYIKMANNFTSFISDLVLKVKQATEYMSRKVNKSTLHDLWKST
jgi:hypothetical protein